MKLRMDEQYCIHVEYVNQVGQTVHFTSDYMSLADVLQVKDEYPYSLVTDTRGKEYAIEEAS